VRVASPGEFLGRLLDTVGLTPRIAVYPTVAEALADKNPG
jgi:anti-sigma B factor antagonist